MDSCAAVAYNRVSKNLVVSDRYNHRMQLFDLDGNFVRLFGGPGKENGKFNNPWGVAIDALGMIYVCDKDNHRVQVRTRIYFYSTSSLSFGNGASTSFTSGAGNVISRMDCINKILYLFHFLGI